MRRASAKRQLRKDLPNVSSEATSQRDSKTNTSSHSIWARSSQAQNTEANLKKDSKRFLAKSKNKTAECCCLSTNCTPLSAPAKPREVWTQATCSNLCLQEANCTASAQPRLTNIANTSKKTLLWKDVSNPSWSTNLRLRTQSLYCVA